MLICNLTNKAVCEIERERKKMHVQTWVCGEWHFKPWQIYPGYPNPTKSDRNIPFRRWLFGRCTFLGRLCLVMVILFFSPLLVAPNRGGGYYSDKTAMYLYYQNKRGRTRNDTNVWHREGEGKRGWGKKRASEWWRLAVGGTTIVFISSFSYPCTLPTRSLPNNPGTDQRWAETSTLVLATLPDMNKLDKAIDQKLTRKSQVKI